MNKLTSAQRDMLLLLDANQGLWFTGGDLARVLYRNHRTPQGATQTAASLVSRGLVAKGRDIDGHVCYRITREGRALLP